MLFLLGFLQMFLLLGFLHAFSVGVSSNVSFVRVSSCFYCWSFFICFNVPPVSLSPAALLSFRCIVTSCGPAPRSLQQSYLVSHVNWKLALSLRFMGQLTPVRGESVSPLNISPTTTHKYFPHLTFPDFCQERICISVLRGIVFAWKAVHDLCVSPVQTFPLRHPGDSCEISLK